MRRVHIPQDRWQRHATAATWPSLPCVFLSFPFLRATILLSALDLVFHQSPRCGRTEIYTSLTNLKAVFALCFFCAKTSRQAGGSMLEMTDCLIPPSQGSERLVGEPSGTHQSWSGPLRAGEVEAAHSRRGWTLTPPERRRPPALIHCSTAPSDHSLASATRAN